MYKPGVSQREQRVLRGRAHLLFAKDATGCTRLHGTGNKINILTSFIGKDGFIPFEKRDMKGKLSRLEFETASSIAISPIETVKLFYAKVFDLDIRLLT